MKKIALLTAACAALAAPAAHAQDYQWVPLVHTAGVTGWVGNNPLPPIKPGDYPKALVRMQPDLPSADGVKALLVLNEVDCSRQRLRGVYMEAFSDRAMKHLIGKKGVSYAWTVAEPGTPSGEIVSVTCEALEGDE